MRFTIVATVLAILGFPSAPSPNSRAMTPSSGVTLRVEEGGRWRADLTIANGGTGTVGRTGQPSLLLRPEAEFGDRLRLIASLQPEEPDSNVASPETVVLEGVELDVPVSLDLGTYHLVVTWTGVSSPRSASAGDGPAECCVVCNDVRFCACRVVAPCGTCCAEKCGGCDEGQVARSGEGGPTAGSGRRPGTSPGARSQR
jgi:hypothetical protein